MSLLLKSVRPSVEWLGEPDLAFAGGLTHIDPKLRIPPFCPRSPARAAIVFITLPAEIVKRYGTVHQTKQGVETVWNLRAGIKARAMQRGLRTQLLRQETIESNLESHTSELDHPADLAWNLFTAAYFKAGGFPWAPLGIPEGTCHLGGTFFRPHGERPPIRTNVAQAFAESGDPFLLRGNQSDSGG